MATVTTGNNTTFNVDIGLVVTVTTSPNTIGTVARTYINEGNDSQTVTEAIGPPAMDSVYGPYDRFCTMTITSKTGTITYVTSGSAIVGSSTDLSYTAATRTIASSTGTDAVLPIATSSDAGLVPATGGGTTNFLRADLTFAEPPGGTASTSRMSLAAKALKYIPFIPSFLSGTRTTVKRGFPRIPWETGKVIAAGAIRSNAGKLYVAQAAGTTGATPPTHGSGSANDGGGSGVTWRWMAPDPRRWITSTAYVENDYINSLGRMYCCTTGGTSGATPPTGAGSVSDGVCQWRSISFVWVDTVNGSSGNGGTSHLDAKDTIANSSGSTQYHHVPAANTHTWVAAGSEFSVDILTAGDNQAGAIYLAIGANITISVYDPVTGNEILDQPNVFELALRGESPSATDIATKYFTVTGNCTDVDITLFTNGKGIGINGGNKVRGARIRGFANCGITPNRNTGIPTNDVWEDLIIEDCRPIPDGSRNYAGRGIHFYNGETVGTVFKNIGIYGSGEDGIWMSYDPNPTGFKLEDIVVQSKPTLQHDNYHTDGIQMPRYPGTVSMTRVFIDHDMSDLTYVDAAPIGAGFIIDTTGTPGTFTLTMTDVIILSNNQTVNWEVMPATTTSCMFYNTSSPDVKGIAYGMEIRAAGTLTNSLCVFEGLRAIDTTFSNVTPTLTNTRQIFVE
jgi:hypothetical protein